MGRCELIVWAWTETMGCGRARGVRRNTRDMFSKAFGQKGLPSMSTYLAPYKVWHPAKPPPFPLTCFMTVQAIEKAGSSDRSNQGLSCVVFSAGRNCVALADIWFLTPGRRLRRHCCERCHPQRHALQVRFSSMRSSVPAVSALALVGHCSGLRFAVCKAHSP